MLSLQLLGVRMNGPTFSRLIARARASLARQLRRLADLLDEATPDDAGGVELQPDPASTPRRGRPGRFRGAAAHWAADACQRRLEGRVGLRRLGGAGRQARLGRGALRRVTRVAEHCSPASGRAL